MQVMHLMPKVVKIHTRSFSLLQLWAEETANSPLQKLHRSHFSLAAGSNFLTTTGCSQHPARDLLSWGIPAGVRDSSAASQEGHETEGPAWPRQACPFPHSQSPQPSVLILFDLPFATGDPGFRFQARLPHVTSHRKVCPYQGRAGI